ncbi:hypothetical protein NDU88_006083 [Pleurodeles waltl]|uniref:Uncharacterized protein n=1 Tax=Pleurodeles waltl TaxID=8319 RepID=A0AAV7WDP1_PLEWA|nr:hypothetical protein NDU88_006083 [Pleurodeles waltl]
MWVACPRELGPINQHSIDGWCKPWSCGLRWTPPAVGACHDCPLLHGGASIFTLDLPGICKWLEGDTLQGSCVVAGLCGGPGSHRAGIREEASERAVTAARPPCFRIQRSPTA